MGNRNRPTREFRREAVRLALTSGRTRREKIVDVPYQPAFSDCKYLICLAACRPVCA